jgi:hypothetical protein
MMFSTICLAAVLFTSVWGQGTNSPSYVQPNPVPKENMFASEYTVVTAKSNFLAKLKRLPDIGQLDEPSNQNFVLGSTITQSGNVFRPNSVNLVQVLGNFAGGVQPETTPDINSAFTFNGQCIATAGIGFATLKAHTCLYNLCLRGSQNCINIYSGTRFDFNAAPSLKLVGFQPSKTLNIVNPFTQDGSILVGPGRAGVTNLLTNSQFFTLNPSKPEFGSNDNPLPPSFPGVIIGGTNDFQGITGNIELVTVAGTLAFEPQVGDFTLVPGTTSNSPPGSNLDLSAGSIKPITFSPTESPTTGFPTPEGSLSPSEQPTGRPTFDGTQAPSEASLEPAIVQKLFVRSNIRLPRAPKAIGSNNRDQETSEDEE